jgi:hypothetical protein
VTIDDMFNELNLYGFDDLENSQKLILLNEAYLDITTREPWPFLEKLVTITQAAQDDTVTIPDGDLGAVLSIIDMSGRLPLSPERADVIEKNYLVNSDTNQPTKYYFVGDTIYLWPVPADQRTLRVLYVREPSALTESSLEADILIPKRHHSIIVYGALVKAYLVNDDPQAATFQNMYETRYQQMRNDVWMKQYDRPDRIHVITESYDWNY